MKKVLLVTTLLLIMATQLASAQSLYSASIDANPVGLQATPKVGERLKITVHIQNTGSIALNGFVVKYKFLKPDGTYTSTYQASFNDLVQPGSGVYKTINTNVVADREGYWTVFVYLYTSDGKTQLSSDSGIFQVNPQTPQAEITITDVAGYAIVGAAALGLALAWRRPK